MSPDSPVVLLMWTLVALAVWRALAALLRPLVSREPVVLSAVLSWLVARLIIWALMTVSHWIGHVLVM
jgi:hypothetical protein